MFSTYLMLHADKKDYVVFTYALVECVLVKVFFKHDILVTKRSGVCHV